MSVTKYRERTKVNLSALNRMSDKQLATIDGIAEDCFQEGVKTGKQKAAYWKRVSTSGFFILMLGVLGTAFISVIIPDIIDYHASSWASAEQQALVPPVAKDPTEQWIISHEASDGTILWREPEEGVHCYKLVESVSRHKHLGCAKVK